MSEEKPKKKKEVASGQSSEVVIAEKVLEILKPQFLEFGNSIKSMVQNEVQALRAEIETVKKMPVGPTATGTLDLNGIMKEIGPVLSSLGLAPPGVPASSPSGSPPSIGLPSPGGIPNLGILQMLPDLLKMVGLGQQQNPMMAMMSEMMMRNFMAQQYRSAVLMDNIVANFVKNPDKLSEFLTTSNSLVEAPIKAAAELIANGPKPGQVK